MSAPVVQELVAIRRPPPASPARARRVGAEIVGCVGVFLLVALPLPYLLRFDHQHYITALLLALMLVALSFYSQRGAIAAAMVFLALLGDYRRYAGFFQGYPTNDPLLLIAPVVALLLLVQALLRGKPTRLTILSGLVLALMLLMAVEMFNPVQGGIAVGFGGALFYLAPLLWFWVARAFASLEFAERFTSWVLVGVGTAAMLLGLYQTYFGLFPFEQHWVEERGYNALYISDEVVRAIGFFGSSAEYQRYLVVTAVTIFALWLTMRSRLVILLPLFLVTIFLSAARGPVVMVIVGMAVAWALAARNVATWVPRLGVAMVCGGAALVGALLLLQTASLGGRVAPLVERQVGGLLDPTNPEKSTATGHFWLIEKGFATGILTPAGEGLGATTQAADKYGTRNRSAEVDLANLMISVGVLGGVLYLAVVVAVFVGGVGWWRRGRHPYALVVVGTLAATLGSWLIGGEYSAAALLWFEIGLMDGLSARAGAVRTRV
jgi:hypothetical protein